ncbi:HlyD family secretion protein [Ralstonia pseudosolanacearum]|uniref:Probable multidrug resistance transmembrane protein n=1 Tax=Ralstonia nicotianae (strain ATCC BAA-1114 / GMI1000) TaxID=267608 RepID=Q8XYA9_RALN1|nr:HlyD family secretion protein [Ralstonia pseudosolanacearum]MCQ4681154.1 HlyD family secretion protein [Ralstonia pseudosolanacearum]CAD15555.1 probable multidrug resistance transmembrane protein [Ralstonia pseudosolanacearum GMI1000]
MSDNNQTADATAAAPSKQRRARLFLILAAVVAAGAIGGTAYWQLYASRFVSTDNAYAAVEIAQVTPAIDGTIAEVRVSDTQAVKKGDVLVVIDPTDAKLALEQAEAQLGSAVRRVRGYVANDSSLGAQIIAREADEKRAAADLFSAQADFERAKIDLRRREALVASGSVSGEELTKARNAHATADAARAAPASAQARANRNAAVGSRQANAVLIANATEDTNPEVALARAKRDQAAVDLGRTVIRAPVDGVVAKRQVQLGQRVKSGTALLSIVPVQDMHVDANFKEVQLENVRIGQPATVKADIYGGSASYRGVVEGFSGGSGAAFAAIPAQNATGNWIKVVQRLPVRIKLDAAELEKHPLKVGLSMVVTIDTSASGSQATQARR